MDYGNYVAVFLVSSDFELEIQEIQGFHGWVTGVERMFSL